MFSAWLKVTNCCAQCWSIIRSLIYLQIKDEQREYDWGIILNFKKRDNKFKNPAKSDAVTLTVDVMIPFCKEEDTSTRNMDMQMEIVTINYNQIVVISAVRLCCPNDLRSSDNQKMILKSLQVSYFLHIFFSH